MAASDDVGDEFIAALGIAVREQRERLGWSQEELGFQAEIHPVYVSGIERGVRNPSVRVIWQVAKALETDVSRLLQRAERLLE